MGWFDEQIRMRKQCDDEVFADCFVNMAAAVMGKKIRNAVNENAEQSRDAIEIIERYFRIKPTPIPDNITDVNDQLDHAMRSKGYMTRVVDLDEGWRKNAIGPMLGRRKDTNEVIALIPFGLSGYFFKDSESGKWFKVTKKNEFLIDTEAICFYRPLLAKKLSINDIILYIFKVITVSDVVLLVWAAISVTIIGTFVPKINHLVMSRVIEDGSLSIFFAVTAMLVCVSISRIMFDSIHSLLSGRLFTRMNLSVEASTMMRILTLPSSFFQKYSAGDLSGRTTYFSTLCESIVNAICMTGLSSLFSLVYIAQIVEYAPGLAIPSLIIIFVSIGFTLLTTFVSMKINEQKMELSAKEGGLSYGLVYGIQKIKLAGAEKRAFAKWANAYSEVAQKTYNPPIYIRLSSVISTAISLIGTIVMYSAAIATRVSVADYYSFNTAYGFVMGAFSSLAGMATIFSQIKPILKMIKPIMEYVPEVSEGKEVVTNISGSIEINNVSFRYKKSMPLVVDNLSLKIHPGQYVAIVGKTGCGKSTLVRLLLGFETPQKGAIYYDGKDLKSLDLSSLRRKIGTVMQNGDLFAGDIFSNIVISAPRLTLDEAWEAAEMAGIADDIKRMPMGMHTIIQEGGGGISGGQKQRLMIARAIAPKPRVLIFDEATSALDNITQKKVSDSLNSLKCTRIVIAHRLSTIMQCDRIILLENGKIVEDGTYDELIKAKGAFAELVERQRVDNE